MPQFIIVLPEGFELEFMTAKEATDFLHEFTATESAYLGLYGVDDPTTLEVREVAYHFTTGGSPIRYFVD